MIKGRELWASLSKNEPENQARPETLEQLIVMLTRESTRRIVHFVNFTSTGVGKLPNHLSNSIAYVTNKCVQIVDLLLKVGKFRFFEMQGFDHFYLYYKIENPTY